MINLWASSAARGPNKEKLVRRSQKNESGKAAVIPADTLSAIISLELLKIHVIQQGALK